ncbi:MAG TPA: hypothetical protein VFA93_02295 [Patescibacteria group bacterium]|nr:hypothetical protein [Patescibacteria group bacterium]
MLKGRWKKVGNPTDTMYGLGFLGAAIYFIQHAHSFSDGVLGILKAIVWPGILVYKVLGLLKM